MATPPAYGSRSSGRWYTIPPPQWPHFSAPLTVQKLHFPCNPYLSTCWMVQRLTSKRLASYCWLTLFDRSAPMYSCCRLVRVGRRPGQRPSARAFAWHATERSLIEFHHYSLKASTIRSGSRSVAVGVSKPSDRDWDSTLARCRPSITCSPQVNPVSGGAKVDPVGGRSLTSGG